MKMFQTKRFILDSLRNRPKRGVRMTIKEASERYNIPMEILREYESWGLCGQHRLCAVFYREFVSEPAHKAR